MVMQQMNLDDICPIVDTVTDLGVLHDLAHRAAHTLNVRDDIVFNALLKREELGSTGVGNGVAIPHVRLEQVKTSFAYYYCQKETREPNSRRWLAWPGDFELRKSFRSCATRPIEWCSITS